MSTQPYNPFAPSRRRQTNDSDVMTPGARAIVSDFRQADAAEARRDPLAEQMKSLNFEDSRLGDVLARQKVVEQEFLSQHGGALFAPDDSGTAKPSKDGTPNSQHAFYLAELRTKAQKRKSGLVANLSGAAGEFTPEAIEAQKRLADEEPAFKAVLDQWGRIQDQGRKVHDARNRVTKQIGELSAAQLARRGVLPVGLIQNISQEGATYPVAHSTSGDKPAAPPATISAPQGFAMRTMPTGKVRTASGSPTILRDFGSESEAEAFHRGGQKPSAASATPATMQPALTAPASPASPSPLALVKLHRQLQANQTAIGMDTTSEELRTALSQKNERLQDMLRKGMTGLPSDQLRQRVIEHTGPMDGFDSLNGGVVTQTGKALARGATAEGIYAGGEGIANFVGNLVTKSLPEIFNKLEELRDMRSGLSPHEVEQRKADRAKQYAKRSGDAVKESGLLRKIGEYADTTKLIRQNIRTALEIDQQFAESKTGQIAQGFGQMGGTVAAGVVGGPAGVAAMSIGQIYDEGYQDAKQSGADDATAHSTAMKYLPAASLDFLSDNLIVGKLLKPLVGKMTVGRFIKEVLVSGAVEGTTEGAQQLYLNQVAKRLQGYDPDRPFDQEVYDSILVGAIVGGGVTAVGEGVKKLGEEKQQPKPAPAAPQAKQGQPVAQPAKPLPDGVRAADNVVYPTAEAAEAAGRAPAAPVEEEVQVDPELLQELRAGLPQESPAPQPVPADRQPAPAIEGVVSTPESLAGDKINREWTAFSPESNSLGIPRAEMPQVKAEHRGALTQFLKGKGIESVEEEVLPGTLKPTQAEFSPAKVDKARGFEGGDRAILVSSDGHVVDGHHQWMAKLTDEPNAPMRVIRLDAPIKDLIETVKEFPSAATTGGATAEEIKMTPLTEEPTKGKFDGRQPVTDKESEGGFRIPPAPASPLAPPQSFRDTRTDLLTKIDAAMIDAPAVSDPKTGTITVQSGSSKFTVTNSKETLQRLRRLVERKIPANDVPGRDDGRPRDQKRVRDDYKAAKTEAERRGYIDQMTPATLKALGLDDKYERIAPGVTMTKDAAQALRDLKAGKRSKFSVQASTGTAESDIDPTAPAALAFSDANEGDYPPGLVQQVREFAAFLNAERRRRGEAGITFTPQKPGTAGADLGSRLPRDGGDGANRGAEQAVRFVRGIERALGKRVVFFKPSAPVAWHAMTSPNRANTILVNTDAGSPLAALIGHELGHNIKVQNPELYRQVRGLVYATAGASSFEYGQAKLAQGYAPEKVEDEWIADVIGQRFDEPEFWRDVRREAEARGEQRAFAEFTREAWEWLTNLLRRIRRVFTREADAVSIRQIDELRRGLATVLTDYQAQMPAGGYPDDPALGDGSDLSNVQASAQGPREGWGYRAGADTERAAGLNTVRQIYERRGQKPDMETADAIISELGIQKAAEVGLSSDGRNGLDTVLREALLIRTMERATEEAAKLKGPERAVLLRLVQRISIDHNPDLTEMGQAISMRQNFNRLDNPAGVLDQAVREAAQAQDAALGGKDSAGKTMKAVKEAMDEGTAAIVKEASKELGAAMRKQSVSKSIWQSYRDRTAARLLRFVEQASVPAPKASLQEFTDRVVAEMRARLAAQLPQPGKVSIPAADVLREALDNREKFADLFAAVRNKFAEEHGEGSPIVELVDTELANLGLRPYNNRLLDRAIKEAHKALQTSAAELARQHFTETDPQAEALADALVNTVGLSGSAATELAGSISTRAKEVVSEARRKALVRLAKKHNSTNVTRRVISAVMRAGLLNNIGAFDVAGLRDAVAKELHLPRLTEEQAGRLVELSNRVRTAENDMARGRAEFALLEKMRLYRGIKAVDLITSMWYANALSSPATHAANFGPGNIVTGLVQVGSMIATNPRQAPQAVAGYLQGLDAGWADAKSIMAKGEGLRDFGDKMGQPGRTLEIADARRDLPGWVPAKGLINLNVGLLRYVGRLMRAADTVFFHAAKDAYLNVTTAKLLAADYKGPELAGKIREALQIAPDVWIKARNRAQAEGWEDTDLALRVANLIQQHRAESIAQAVGSPSQEMAAGAQLFGEQSTINQTPEGLAGVVYQGLSYVTQGVRVKGVPVLKPFLMFLRIPTNIFNTSLNLTPVGALRAWNGAMLGEVKPGAVEGEETFTRRIMADDERARLYAQSAFGSLMMAAIATAALSGDDDKERWFDVTAKGPDDYRKRQQLEQTGWRPYSLKFGDRWISYRDTVLLIPLALVGAYVDAARYSKIADESLSNRLTNAAAKAPQAIFETSMLQGLGELLDVMRGESSAVRMKSFLSRVAVTAQPYVPGTAMLNAIDRTLFPEQREADALGGALTASTPFVRNLGSQRSDVLGEPVKRSPWDRFSSAETNDPLREALRDKGVFISTPSRSTKLGNEVMDEDTYRDYVRISGDRIRKRLAPLVPRLRTATKETAEKTVDSITEQEREAVKNMLRSRQRATAAPAVYNPFSVSR